MTQTPKILVIDCQACGVAGDMLLGGLIDLGASVDKVTSAIKSLEQPDFGYENVQIALNPVMRGEFKATQIDVTAAKAQKKHGNELVAIVENAASNLQLSDKAQSFASQSIRTLIGAEADLHKTSFDDAHLHEVSKVDTAAEILGCAVALDDLGLFDAKIYSTPVAVGGGTFEFSHGIVSAPAPATLAILESKHFPFHGGPIEAELATPTGVSILTSLANEVSQFYPSIVPLRVGYGAGSRDYPKLPSVLRITLGEMPDEGLVRDEISVLETNVDDVAGEVLGYTMEKLFTEGAKDVTFLPMFTKKNRPGQIIKVICEPKDVSHLSRVLIDQTGTLGVRIYNCERHIANREVLTVDLLLLGNLETVKVKIAKNLKGEIVRIKPEYEDLKRLAQKTKIPLRKLLDLAVSVTQEKFLKK